MAALDDSPRPGRAPVIHAGGARLRGRSRLPQPRAFGYPHELWTTRLLADHAREHGPEQGHPSLATLVQGTLCKILNAHHLKPRKVRHDLERRDLEARMAEVLCVSREVALLKEAGGNGEARDVAILSYDEKPGIRAIGTTSDDDERRPAAGPRSASKPDARP